MSADTSHGTDTDDRDSPIVERLLGAYGNDLQGVMTYEGDEYNVLYLRGDLEAEYDEDAIAEVYDEAILESMMTTRYEDVFAFGELEYVVRGFERVAVVQVFGDETRGIVYSTDGREQVAVEEVIAELPTGELSE